MSNRKPKWFGGRGTGRPQGDPATDPMGTVRRAPDGRWIAIMWPSGRHPQAWMVADRNGSAGYERPERVAHWPVVGPVPFSPAAGTELRPHPPIKPQPAQAPMCGPAVTR